MLECEKVGFGVTGPMERSEAAKWGSRASRSIAIQYVSRQTLSKESKE